MALAINIPSGSFADPNLTLDRASAYEQGGVMFADVRRKGVEEPVFLLAWDPSKVGARIAPAESDEQSVFVNSARRSGMRLHSVPNGGFREARTAVNMKREGMSAGAPDLIVWGGPKAGEHPFDPPPVAMEFKRANGELGDFALNQLEWLEYIHTHSPAWAVGVLGYKAGLEVLRKAGYKL